MINSIRKAMGENNDVLLAIAVIGILTILFTPIPPRLLDFLLISNFSFALLLLLLTFYMAKPVEFSTFPSLLLIATLFRLSLNVAATRLILADADAGRVIAAIGSHVVGGNYVIGLIVFLILVVVQYVVVTSGAQRVAEVAARFTLDSMPGQQMAIDADLNMGFIDQEEAKKRRKNLEKEAKFYGSMDGASKFVKGDAIAGIIILLINMIGGLIIGIMQHGMKWDDALQTYTLLTIGDGIVTQVPALIIAVGTGIIVTRSGSDSELSSEIVSQIFSFPKTLILVALVLFGLLVLPGMPAFPIIILLLLVGSLISYSFRHKSESLLSDTAETKAAEAETEDAYDLLTVEPVEVAVGQNLIGMVNTDESLFLERISVFRKQHVTDAGFVLPKIRFRDEKKLPTNNYEIRMFGVALARGEIVPDRFLAIHSGGERTKLRGIETKDPTYGLPAYWITEDERGEARTAGYTLVDPVTVFMTHLSETLRQHAASLLTRAETDRLIDRVRKSQASLVEELIPGVLTLSEIQKVLQNLLKEKVSIRNLESILEILVDTGRHTKDADALTEIVRQRLGPVICQSLSGDSGYLHVLTLDPKIEQTLASSIRSLDERNTLVLEPRFAEQMLTKLAVQVETMMKSNLMPVLLCSPELRRHIRRVTERVMPHLSILSMAEVPNSVNLKSFAVVTV